MVSVRAPIVKEPGFVDGRVRFSTGMTCNEAIPSLRRHNYVTNLVSGSTGLVQPIDQMQFYYPLFYKIPSEVDGKIPIFHCESRHYGDVLTKGKNIAIFRLIIIL